SVLQQVDSLFWKKQSDFGTSGSSLPRTPHLPWQIGQNVQGEGIYFGVLDLHKNYGSPDEKAYYLFAAPVDLAGPDGRALSLTFEQAADEVSKLSNFFGHDGAFYDDDRALFADLKADRYGGGWVIPPLPFLNGAGAERGFQGDNLFNHRSVGAFDGTYTAKQEDGRMFYWSSSLWPHSSFFVANVDFASGDCDYFSRNRAALSVRVCRLVPVL
ncbi:MAG: hypothetical protein PHE27_04830, partial [Alphaproteobacteria bacterium]|nr:hypothetical protein [Alphaproteobacteria bacterium]